MSKEGLNYGDNVQQPPAFGAERTLGVYPQRQQDLFFQRIRVLGGRISWLQWRKVACLVRRYSQRRTFHITTRQDIELHDMAGPVIKDIQEELAAVGLITKGAGGDTVVGQPAADLPQAPLP